MSISSNTKKRFQSILKQLAITTKIEADDTDPKVRSFCTVDKGIYYFYQNYRQWNSDDKSRIWRLWVGLYLSNPQYNSNR